MIIRERPSVWRLFFILRGSVIHKVMPQILFSALLGIFVFYFHRQIDSLGLVLTPVPFTILGLALAIFLGFKNTVAYDRYWESRRLWGELIISSRTLARQALTFLPDGEEALQTRMTRTTIAFAYALRNHLRASELRSESRAASLDETFKFLDKADAESLKGRPNLPDALIRNLSRDLKICLTRKIIEPQMAQAMDETLSTFARILGGCERIRSTPIPFSYTLLLHRTAYLYCFLLPFGLVDSVGVVMPIVVGLVSYTFFGLEALGEELEEPFGTSPNDLPLNTLCRTI